MNLPPNSLAAQGLDLPPRKNQAFASPIPETRINWLSPRFEPANISARATTESIQNAIRMAENGDPTTLFRFYRDAVLGDDHVQGELNKRKLAVIGQPLTILPAEKDNPEDQLAAAICMRGMADCENWVDALGALMDSASIWPVTLQENIFRPADPRPVMLAAKSVAIQYTLKRLEPVNPMLFCFMQAYLVGGVGLGTSSPLQQTGLMKPNQNGVTGTAPWYEINVNDWEPFLRLWPIDEAGRIIYDSANAAKLDPQRHIVHRGHLLTQMRDNWGGPGRCILAWWLLRGLGRDWFGRFMERYGSPFPVAKTNVQDAQSVAFMREAFSTFTKIGGLVIGQDDQVDLQNAVVQGGAEGHKLWHDTCNDAISLIITGYKASAKPGGLNTGQQSENENVREDIRIFDQKRMAETLQKQPFARLLKVNGCAGAIRIIWGGLSDADAATFSQLIKTMGEAGYQVAEDSMVTVEERTGLQWERKAPAPAPVFAAPGQAASHATKDDSENENEGEDEDDIKTLADGGKS